MFKHKALTALALTSLLGVAACGSTKDSTENDTTAPAATATAAAGGGAIKEGLKIAFLPKQINNPYFTISDKGGEDAVTAVKGDYKRVGPSDWHTNQILKDKGPLDILVLGNSRMLTAIDHEALRENVQEPDGPLKSETIAARFNGFDLSYTFLRDFFAHRHARLVVINYPDIPQIDNHPGEKYIRRFGQPDPGLEIKRPALAIAR